MRAFTNRNLVAAAVVALASYGVTACIDGGALDAPAETSVVPDVTYDDVGALSVASNFAVLGEFVGYVDPERGIFEVRMVDDLDEAGAVADELREAHQRVDVSAPTGWCKATIDRDGTAGTGAAGTVEFYTPWGEIDKSIDECLTRIGDDALSETSFPNGVLCADVIIRSFFTSQLENVYAEITSHSGESNQYGYAFPLGNGAERPDFGRNRPGLDFGLWSYGNLTTDSPERKVVWTFKFGSTTPFTFGGRVIYSIAEDCDNGTDDDCDGIADNACNEFHDGTTCIIDDDCAGDSTCDGGALDSGSGDVDGACKCNTVDPPYHDGACSATCGDGTQNGAEEGIDCGGPCDSCGPSETKIFPSDLVSGDSYGTDVDVSGDYAVVGMRFDDDVATDAGAVYVFERSGGTWTNVAKLTAPGLLAGDALGVSVAIDGDWIVAGAVADDHAGESSGAAHVFHRGTGGTWTHAQKLTASDAGGGDNFGVSVAISGTTIIIGAPFYDIDATANAGAAYIYDYDAGGGSWTETTRLVASDAAAGDRFGHSVAISTIWALIGSPVNNSTGEAYVFKLEDGSWLQYQILFGVDSASDDNYGHSVAISSDEQHLLVGAPFADSGGSNAGATYAYSFGSSTALWGEEQKLTASDGAADAIFGIDVTIHGTRAIIGASQVTTAAGLFAGAAYVFDFSTGWAESSKITASDASAFAFFGASVALDGTRIIASATGHSSNKGMAYIIDL